MSNEWLWTQSPVAFTSQSRVEQFIRDHYLSGGGGDNKVKRREALASWKEYASTLPSLQLYAPHHLNYKKKLDTTRVAVPRRNYQWQMDLVDLSKQSASIKRVNKGYVYILVGIDVLSRFVVCTTPMKQKNGEEVAKHMRDVACVH